MIKQEVLPTINMASNAFLIFFFFTLSIFSGDSETTSVQSALTYKLTVMTVIAVDPQIFDSQYY